MRQTIRQIRADIDQAKKWGYDTSDLEAALDEANSARDSDEPMAWNRIAARNDRDHTARHYWVIPRTEIGSQVRSTAINPTGWTQPESGTAEPSPWSESLVEASGGVTIVARLPRSKPRIWVDRARRQTPDDTDSDQPG